MINAWSRFRALDAERRRLVLEAAVTLAIVWVGLRTIPLGHLRRCLEAHSRRRPARSASSTAAIAWAVQAAGRRFPGGRTCLVEALAADAMLRRRSYHSDVRLGVRKKTDRSFLDGHAWVECDGVVVVGAVDDLETYKALRDARLLSRTQTAGTTEGFQETRKQEEEAGEKTHGSRPPARAVGAPAQGLRRSHSAE